MSEHLYSKEAVERIQHLSECYACQQLEMQGTKQIIYGGITVGTVVLVLVCMFCGILRK